MKALSIRQPWAWLIVNGYKDVENRTWSTNYRGDLLIHAGHNFEFDSISWILSKFTELKGILPLNKHDYDLGGLIGKVTLVNCTRHHESPWFTGPIGWLFDNAASMTLIPYKGHLGLFDVQINRSNL